MHCSNVETRPALIAAVFKDCQRQLPVHVSSTAPRVKSGVLLDFFACATCVACDTTPSVLNAGARAPDCIERLPKELDLSKFAARIHSQSREIQFPGNANSVWSEHAEIRVR